MMLSSASRGSEMLLGDLRDLGELLEALADHRGQQRLLRGKVAIDGADADAGVGGDLVHLHVRALAGEQLAARGHDPLAVAAGIGAKCSLIGCRRTPQTES